jgi:hypothetical protein
VCVTVEDLTLLSISKWLLKIKSIINNVTSLSVLFPHFLSFSLGGMSDIFIVLQQKVHEKYYYYFRTRFGNYSKR